jgi:hypothetical protein
MRKSTMFNLFVVAILGLVLPDRAFGQQKPLKDLLVGTWLQATVGGLLVDRGILTQTHRRLPWQPGTEILTAEPADRFKSGARFGRSHNSVPLLMVG